MATARSQRELILVAMIRVVGRTGYRAASMVDVIEEAGVSEETFHRYFDDKSDCFLIAYDAVVHEIFDEVVAGCNGDRPWLKRVQTGLSALVHRLALDPALARTAVVEVMAAGPEARQRQWDAINRFTEFLAGGRDLTGDRELPGNVDLMAAGAVSGLIFDEVLAGRADRLPERLPDLVFAMLAPYVGPSAAAAEMRSASAG